ncbi:hypothetical protein GG804_18420 [Sphingomonas histidinilytica]|uniref:hypothetical protein n=1 Tax=Rhizorhabdus histidinilytica TaxID=439228 RepID=UPI001ADC1BA6|nr:hypothetical protein [Rhizorhabdus histidinilytica]MBO9378748.1 hypothetical protein [Rhizorhabdus histidinilytica]
MSYPLDQITALARANGELALKFAEIARAGGEECAQIGSKAAALFVDQLKELKPGTVPSLKSEAVTSMFNEAEKSREMAATKFKAAIDEWQGSWKDLLSQATNQQQLTDTLQAWFRPLAKTAATEPAKPSEPARSPAKVPQAA